MDDRVTFQTKSGYTTTYDKIDWSKITFDDMAWSLVHINRFAGNYGNCTVLEHSLRVYDLLVDRGVLAHVRLQGLLHDVPEMIVSDIPSAIKRLSPEIMEFEDNLFKSLMIQFNLPTKLLSEVKEADDLALSLEKGLCSVSLSNPLSKKTRDFLIRQFVTTAKQLLVDSEIASKTTFY